MSEWKTVKLSDICTLEKGQQIDTTLLDDSKPYRYINGGIKESGYFDNFNTSGESVLISEGGASCGFINYVNEKFWCGCHCYRLHDIKVFPKYLFHALKANQQRIMALRTGSAMPNIQKSTIQKFELKIHDDSTTQKKVSTMLDKCNELIEKHKQTLEKYDILIKSRFIEMFGDPSKNNKKWEIKKLGDIIRVLGGYAFSSKAFKDSGIPVLRIGNINSGVFRPTNMVFWDDDEKIERYAIYPGDLVMSLTGTVGKDDYGNVCILGNDYPKYYLNQRNAKLEIISDLERFYLSYLLKFPEIKSRLTNISRGIRQANIANKDIENLQIPVPPIELQNDFTVFVQQIDKSKFEIWLTLQNYKIIEKRVF